MSHRPSLFPTFPIAAVCLCTLVGFVSANGPPIRLADPAQVPFPGTSLVVADLDGASGLDLIGVSGSDVVAALNDGHGHFGPLLTIPMGGATLAALEVGDLDGDGRNDLVALSGARSVTARLNGPGLVFGPPEVDELPGDAGWRLRLGDLSGDGRPDVAVTCPSSGCVAVLLNDGAGHLGPALRLDVPGVLFAPLIGDFTGDGFADLAVGVATPAAQLVLLAGKGDGTFQPPVAASPEGTNFVHVAAADLDGDGDLDIVSTNEWDLVVSPNQGDGSFGAPQILGGQLSAYFDPVVGDVDRDGRPDIALSIRSVWFGPLGFLTVYRNRGGLLFGPVMSHGVEPYVEDVALADLDGDGWQEGIATHIDSPYGVCGPAEPPGVSILHNSGTGALEGMLEVPDPVWLPVRSGALEIPDLIGASQVGRMYRARNYGNGTFDTAQAVGWGTPLAARDLDADGDEDLVVTSGDSTWVLPNLGAAGFGAPGFTLVGFAFRDFADFTGDGRLDMLTTAPDSELVMFPGDGACGFGAPVHYGRHVPVGQDADDVRGADLDRDSFADVLYAKMERPESGDHDYVTKLFTLLNDRAGGLGDPDSSVASIPYENSPSHGPGFLRLGDWNGDGVLDAVHATDACQSGSGATEVVFLGTGTGTFATVGAAHGGGASWCDVRAGDLNGDHLDDLVYIVSTAGCTLDAIPCTSVGTGEFSDCGRYPMGVEPQEAHLCDLDGDGRLDLVTRNLRMDVRLSYSVRRNVTPTDVPTPTLAALISARVESGVVHLDWFAAGEGFTAAIERRSTATGWGALASRSSDGTGHLRYEDRQVEAGERYAYRLRVAGGDRTGETWVSVPDVTFSLRGASPNPSSGQPAFTFTLPAAGEAELHVLDVAGRIVRRERLAGLGPGTHRVTLSGPALAPGYYQVRLGFGGRSLRSSVVVLK